MTCRKCGQPMTAATGPGRPRRFCSPLCKRTADYERRRVQRALERVERQIRTCRATGAKAAAEGFEAERLRLEERLRELLDDSTADEGEQAE